MPEQVDFQIVSVNHPLATGIQPTEPCLEYRLLIPVMTDGGAKRMLLRMGEEDWASLSDQVIEMLAATPISPDVR